VLISIGRFPRLPAGSHFHLRSTRKRLAHTKERYSFEKKHRYYCHYLSIRNFRFFLFYLSFSPTLAQGCFSFLGYILIDQISNRINPLNQHKMSQMIFVTAKIKQL